MRILDLYSKLHASRGDMHEGYGWLDGDPALSRIAGLAREWEMDHASFREWFAKPEAVRQHAIAREYLALAPQIVASVEKTFGRELPGTLVFMPSFGEFDGFARYELGEHTVLFGVDFPGSSLDYLRALTAHELSHVYRDHAPRVWGHLGKPLREVSRQEYLDAGSAQEHLVSEGLATLFSQALFPEIPAVTHHYYEEAEWRWCVENDEKIAASLLRTLREDGDVWAYYGLSHVAEGSPSRTQYYWAAKMLARRLEKLDAAAALRALVDLHERPATEFEEFRG